MKCIQTGGKSREEEEKSKNLFTVRLGKERTPIAIVREGEGKNSLLDGARGTKEKRVSCACLSVLWKDKCHWPRFPLEVHSTCACVCVYLHTHTRAHTQSIYVSDFSKHISNKNRKQ